MRYYSWEWFEYAAQYLAQQLRTSGRTFTAIYGVPRGGLVLATRLSHVLKLPLLLDAHDVDALTLIVDDNTVSGDSLSAFARAGNTTVALVHNPISITVPTFYVDDCDAWPVFPWEIATTEVALLAYDVASIERAQ